MPLRPSLLSLLALSLSAAAPEAPRSLRALRTQAPVVLDGMLDEGAWASAPVATGFRVSQPDLGAPSRVESEVRILFDDEALYIGARLLHPGGLKGIFRPLFRRDQDAISDWFGVYLDSQRDGRTALGFLVNPAGVQQDRIVTQEFNEDTSWDAVWESAVSVDDGGWTVEMRLPLSLFRIRPEGAGQVWGINFLRVDMLPRRELSLWRVVPRDMNAWVSAFPALEGLEGLRPTPRREWVPYVSTQRKFETAQSFDDRRFRGRAGLDAHLGVGQASLVDLSLRPDFGQVEVDQAVLNLGTVETYLPEKRPFFLEGMDLFQFTGAELFYSRRIGRGASAPDLAPGEQLLDCPPAGEILGAAKWTTRTPGGLGLGILAAGVEPVRARVLRTDGGVDTREAAPATQVGVVRATQSLDDRGTFLGGFGSWFREAGGRQSDVAGLDGVIASADRTRRIEAAVAGSRLVQDGNVHQDSWLRAKVDQRLPGGWGIAATFLRVGRDFNPNDLGYLPRPDETSLRVDVRKNWDVPWGGLQARSWRLFLGDERDLAGHVFNRYLNTNYRVELPGGWAVLAGLEHDFAGEDDRELRTFRAPRKTYLPVEAVTVPYLNVESPYHWPWTFGFFVNRVPWSGGPSRNAQLWQAWRPVPSLELRAETTWTRETGERHYSGLQAAVPVTGLRRLTCLGQTLSVAYAFTPNLTLQGFSQWMSASWTFRHLEARPADGTALFLAGQSGPDVSDRLWNLHALLRWEFRPGSTLYAVYTHGAVDGERGPEPGSLRLRHDFARLRRAPSDDVVQLKCSWLFR